jgi:hypothetical protein
MIQNPGEIVHSPVLTFLLEYDPVVKAYRELFADIDWGRVVERDERKPWPGRTPHPQRAYVKALTLKVNEQCSGMEKLRNFLLRHPPLVLEIGFRPVLDASHPYGFDVEKTVPSTRWLNQKQRHLANDILQELLGMSAQVLAQCVADEQQSSTEPLGETVEVDTKHIYGCVCENNAKETLPNRFDPQRRPRGDADCRLGIKRRVNQVRSDGKVAVKAESLWGYGSGIMTATHPACGDVVLADYTQPFHQADVTYFAPLYQRAVAHLPHPPKNLAADAAFDAWHVYQPFAQQQGMAAIPLNERGFAPPQLSAKGIHLCPRGWEMHPGSIYFDTSRGHRVQRLHCPLLHPQPTGQRCDHEQFAKGIGCEKRINYEAGGRLRVALDRQSASFKQLYRQRSAVERINSQAKSLGIERPKVRNLASVSNLNTLIYLVINLNTWQRYKRTVTQRPKHELLC